MIELSGRVAVVTGAAQGIGRATAELFLSLGASVVVVDQAAAALEALAATHAGAALAPCQGDVTEPATADRAVETAIERFGRLDILVNNAGITRDELLFRMTEEQFDTVLATHLRGAFLFSRAAQKPMVAQHYGKIVMISSRASLGNRGQTNYSTAKAGLIGMAKTMAIELGPFGINVNAVAPGYIDTAMTRGTAERVGRDFDDVKAEVIARTPLRRVGTPQDVANVIAFLASDASSFVSGDTIYVAGGPAGIL